MSGDGGDSAGTSSALAGLVDGLYSRLAAGGRIDLEAALREHREYADELRRLLPALGALEELSRSGEGAPGLTPGAAFVVQGAKLVDALGAEDAEPVTDLAAGDTQQVGHLLTSLPLVDPHQGRETLVNAPVVGLLPPPLDLLTLLATQLDRLHRSLPPTLLCPSDPFLLGTMVGSSGSP
jgi:hypothetical protein